MRLISFLLPNGMSLVTFTFALAFVEGDDWEALGGLISSISES